jgi:electron transfer flavoprotein beta subunit
LRVACLADLSVGPGGLTYCDDGGGQDPARGRRHLAPAEATACAFALDLKRHRPDTYVEVVALGPPGVSAELEDLLRLGADSATLLSDPAFAGSDSLVRSRILAGYLRDLPFDCILAGTRTADGAASEVPPLLAELLALPQVSDVERVDEASLAEGVALVDVDDGRQLVTCRVRLPAVLSLKHHRTQVPPHLRLRDANTDVRDRLQVIDSQRLGLAGTDVGIEGSLTQVVGVLDPHARLREPLVVRCDDEGIERVHAFLHSRGLV